MLKKITKIFVSLILILSVVFGAIYFYVKRHKVEVVNYIVNIITDNHNGSVHFDDISLKVLGNFTNPAFYVQNMVILDSTSQKSNRLTVESLYLKLSIRHLLNKRIQIKSMRIENANYNSVVYIEKLDSLTAKEDSQTKKRAIIEDYKPYNMDFDIENITFDIQNIPRHKKIKFKVNKIASKLLIGPDHISSSLDLDAEIDQLGFNLEKGSFLKDSKVTGTMHPEIDRANNKIHIPSFDLSINDQIFKLTADFDTTKPGSFLFDLENEKTAYATTVKLLTEHIQQKLDKYKISQDFYTHTTIAGSFAPLSNPVVHIDFNTVKNTALINDRFNLDNLSFKGNFTNRIYDDERAKTESRKDLKLVFDTITGNYKESKFELIDGELISTPQDEGKIKGSLKAEGLPEDLISFIKKPVFMLEKGRYNLTAQLQGDVTSAADLLTQSDVTLKVINTELFDLEDKLTIPLNNINIRIKENHAVLDTLKIPLTSSNDINITGEVSHFSSILIPNPKISATTKFTLNSNRLNWTDFLELFETKKKTPKENRKQPVIALANISRKIYQTFDPTLIVDIKAFQFKTYEINNLTTTLEFSDENHLHLKNALFDTYGGHVNLQSSVNFADAQQIIIDSDVIITGTSEILNDLFKSNTFFFKGGTFNLHGQVHGDVLRLENFLNTLNGGLRITNSSVFYEPSNLTVPIDVLDVELKNNLALLNSLDIGVGVNDKIELSGKLENFSAFLYSKNKTQINSSFNLHSDKLQWDDFVDFFKKYDEKEKHVHSESAIFKIKKVLRDIQASFNPNLNVSIDRFEYKNELALNNFSTKLYFDPTNTLVLNSSSFDYNKTTTAEFEGSIDLSEAVTTNINVDFKALFSPVDFNKILKNKTFLFEGGTIELSSKIIGDIEDINKLISASTAKVKIEHSNFIYNPNKLHIPFSRFELDIKNDDAFLESMDIALPSQDTIKLSGSLNNFTSFLPEISGNTERMSSKIKIDASRLQWTEFMAFFSKDGVKKKKEHLFKPMLKDIYNKYQPDVSINIEELVYKKLILNDFKTGLNFKNENVIHLDQTKFDFYSGNVSMDALLNIKDPFKTDFSFDLTTDNIDLEKLLISFDYFNTTSLKDADKIDGKVNLDSRIEGQVIDSIGLVSKSLKGRVGFNIKDMQLKGFEPMIKVGKTVLMKKRMEDVRFSTLDDVLYLENNTIIFPLMEIQSTAFDFFVSGHLGHSKASTSLWTAIPLSNLKKRDSAIIPAKKTYNEAGKKIFLNVVDNTKKKGMKYKLYLSDKKYNKAQDSINANQAKYKESEVQY